MIVGSCAKCGQKLFHDSRFVSDGLNTYCADHAPERPGTPIDETLPFKIAVDPSLPPDTAEIRDPQGKVVMRVTGIGPSEPKHTDEFLVMGYKAGKDVACSRCKLRLPMAGADFCEWCARDEDFSLGAVTAHSLTVTLNTRDCPACKVAIRRDDVQYRVGQVWYHAACAYRISKEARDERGRKMDAAMHAMGMPKDCTLFPPDGAKIVMNRPVRSDKWEAAERLARLVLDWEAGTRVSWKDCVAEAKRVLGEKP